MGICEMHQFPGHQKERKGERDGRIVRSIWLGRGKKSKNKKTVTDIQKEQRQLKERSKKKGGWGFSFCFQKKK